MHSRDGLYRGMRAMYCICQLTALLPGRDVTVASDVIAIDVQAVLGAIPGGGMDGMG